MAKSKSSASSATRKKHVAKKTSSTDEHHDNADSNSPTQPTQRGQKKPKVSRFEPKLKSYTPPPPPPKGAPDPVDLFLHGGAGVHPELLVTLRLLGKRDEASLARAIEALDAWVRPLVNLTEDHNDYGRIEELERCTDVWAHHLPRLILHPSRRLRFLALSLHSLLTLPSPSLLLTATRTALLADRWTIQSSYIGAWCVASFDADRGCRALAKASWDASGLSATAVGAQGEGVWPFALGLVVSPPSSSGTEDGDPTLIQAQGLLALAHIVVIHPHDIDVAPLADGAIWALLSHDSPLALRRAAYELLGAVSERVERWRENDVAAVASNVLQFVWGQSEGWAGVVAFLRKYPEAWTLPDTVAEHDSSPFTPSPILRLLLVHLQTSCSSAPVLYPTILLLLSTIPTSILPPTAAALNVLFEAFFASPPSSEWASAALECLLWEAARMDDDEGRMALLEKYIDQLWVFMVRGRVGRKMALELETALGRLVARNLGLFSRPWTSICTTALAPGNLTPPLAHALAVFSKSKSPVLQEEGRNLAVKCALLAIEREELLFVESIRQVVEGDADVAEAMTVLSLTRVSDLLRDPISRPEALAFLISQLSSPLLPPATKSLIWESVFLPSPTDSATLRSLIHEVKAGSIVGLQLDNAGVDDAVHAMAERVLGGSGTVEEEEVVAELMNSPHPFISRFTATALVEETAALLVSQTSAAFLLPTVGTEPKPELLAPVRLLKLSDASVSDATVVALFEAAVLFDIDEAIGTWEVRGKELVGHILGELGALLLDESVWVSPIDVVNAAATLLATFPSSTYTLPHLLPSLDTFRSLSANIRSPPPPSVSILAPLVPQSSPHLPPPVSSTAFPRVVLALLDIAARDTRWARKNLGCLPFILLFIDVARDEQALPRGVFMPQVEEGVVAAAEGLAAYVLSSAVNGLDDKWHVATIGTLRAEAPVATSDELTSVLDDLARRGRAKDEVYARRGFASILAAILRYADGSVGDAERWLAWGQSLPEGLDLVCAIVFAVKGVLVESARFERYQNELASTLAGVPSSAASSRGVALLRVLLASAPPLDAPIIFLPQQRTMFLIQNIQRWIASDNDLEEEIHSTIAELFLHLAPIVQDLSGSHWDLVFDLIESNLETASWTEDATLPALYHSCRLVAEMKDLAASNAELRATVKSRIDKSLALIRDLFVSRPDSGSHYKPRLMILEIMAGLIRDLPPRLLSMGASFDQLLHLLKDPSLPVQHSAYELLSRISAKHVSDLVVELELADDSAASAALLPSTLISLISAKLPVDAIERPEAFAAVSTYLLGWMTVFRFFDHASPRIKAGYIDQLRRLDLVASSLIPSVFGLLHLSDRTRVFDVTPWAVDDFSVELMDDVTAETLSVFASFLYYRSLQALPSLIRSWWEACKNRQLSMAVASFTSKNFSPVLIAHELALLRDPDDPIGKALRDNDDFTVKVAAGANEVKAVFVVDEQNMEIGIRLPSEFPLVGVEVKDVRKVGVTDAQWRAWLLAVQQVVTAQNGLIADALGLFKRNVTLHFEGVEACAICYSVISVVDRSLPTKACRTCSNRFHASCLFKWFTTSHGSSCPLCRSLF